MVEDRAKLMRAIADEDTPQRRRRVNFDDPLYQPAVSVLLPRGSVEVRFEEHVDDLTEGLVVFAGAPELPANVI
jgi:hypothetical protein